MFSLPEDESDFIDEVAVRFLIVDKFTEAAIYKKVDVYYKDFVRHRTDLQLYGYNLKPEDYDTMNMAYKENYSKNKDIHGLCIYVKEMYQVLGIKRTETFTYTKDEN